MTCSSVSPHGSARRITPREPVIVADYGSARRTPVRRRRWRRREGQLGGGPFVDPGLLDRAAAGERGRLKVGTARGGAGLKRARDSG